MCLCRVRVPVALGGATIPLSPGKGRIRTKAHCMPAVTHHARHLLKGTRTADRCCKAPKCFARRLWYSPIGICPGLIAADCGIR